MDRRITIKEYKNLIENICGQDCSGSELRDVNNAPKIENRLYFAKDTSPRIVNFKVESWEYECS